MGKRKVCRETTVSTDMEASQEGNMRQERKFPFLLRELPPGERVATSQLSVTISELRSFANAAIHEADKRAKF